MNQDTRKDPRAKVLTMTVRYKSATLDEFIEHHSYDVSRGGMFIKTPSPFPPGTLLKFEVKIADEQRLMQGVGRVVWKREASDGDNADKPAGMGVKFIKIDDESRRTIDRLVEARAEGDNAFDQGSSQGSAASRLPVASAPTVASASSSVPAGSADPPVRSRKATVIGLGAMKPSGNANRSVAISSGPPRQVPPIAEKPAAEPFFPKSDSRAEMPPVEDQTMMKQAKELLADALRYAGGSAEDVKAAAKVSSIPPHVPRPEPHRSVPPRPSKRTESEPAMKATPRPPLAEHGNEEGEAATTIWRAHEAAALLAESMKDSVPPEGEEIHGRITARPPGEAAPEFRESEPATVPGASPDAESEKDKAKPLLDAVDDEKSRPDLPALNTADTIVDAKPPHKETAAKTAASKPADKAEKPKAAAAVSVGERPSSRSRASQAMLEAAQETADAGGGGKGVFALVALAAAAGIAFYLTRPAPPPPPTLERPPEAANVEPPKEVEPAPTPAQLVTASAVAETASAAPPAPASAEPMASAAPAASAEPPKPAPEQKAAEAKPPVVRKVVPRRVPRKKVEPPPETPEAPPEAPATPPAEAAPEAPPPTPPAPTTPPTTPPSPTPPPLGDNPY